MVRAWMADVTPLLEENCYRQIYERLPLFRREKADALRRPEAKAQSVGAWTLWEKIRAEYGLPESSVYNLSHSGKCVMCAAELTSSAGSMIIVLPYRIVWLIIGLLHIRQSLILRKKDCCVVWTEPVQSMQSVKKLTVYWESDEFLSIKRIVSA